MTQEIKQKIVGVRIKADAPVSSPEPQKLSDVDPLTLRIDRRPNGSLDAVSEKIEYSTSEGKKKVYLLVSFMPVEGIHKGLPVRVERPIEFFYPVGQDQWIAATMRSLSLAARGGYVSQALADLRKVEWANGPVRCGKNAFGKPLYHPSEVAALAWSIQQILQRRGFLDEDGGLLPLGTMEAKVDTFLPVPAPVQEALAAVPQGLGTAVNKVGTCPECKGVQVLRDGCPTCVDCGHSKCG